MSLGSVRKKGYLFKLPVKGLVKKWSKRWFVLHTTSHEGVVRIEYFDSAEYEVTGVGKRTIPLRDVSALAQIAGSKIQPYIFQFTSQIGYHVFATESQTDLDEWMEGIRECVKEDRMRMRKKKTQSLVITSGDDDFKEKTVRRKESSGSTYIHEPSNAGTYRVTLEQNETTERLNLSGSYNLEITPNNILLISPNSGATLTVWQYKHLKNYGKMHGRFHFETGRGAQCGVASFVFVTTCSKEIFGIIHRNIKKLRAEKEQQQKQSLEEQVSKAKTATAKQTQATKPVTKQVKTEGRPRPRSKVAEEGVAGAPTAGTYRSSRDLEDGNGHEDHVYDLVALDEEDVSHLYAQVDKKKQKSSGQPHRPSPYGATHTDSAMQHASFNPPQATRATANRTSYGSARDSRDSALMELNPLAADDNGHDALPLISPVYNPFNQATVGAAPSSNTAGQSDDTFFASFDQTEVNSTNPTSNAPFQQQFNQDPWSAQQSPSFDQPGPTNAQLNQQELDDIWEGISATINDSQQF